MNILEYIHRLRGTRNQHSKHLIPINIMDIVSSNILNLHYFGICDADCVTYDYSTLTIKNSNLLGWTEGRPLTSLFTPTQVTRETTSTIRRDRRDPSGPHITNTTSFSPITFRSSSQNLHVSFFLRHAHPSTLVVTVYGPVVAGKWSTHRRYRRTVRSWTEE